MKTAMRRVAPYIMGVGLVGGISYQLGRSSAAPDPISVERQIFRAEQIGMCEGAAWSTGARTNKTSSEEDHAWATAIVDAHRGEPDLLSAHCMGSGT